MNRLQCLKRPPRALDYNRDPDPKHWKTINGAKVHLDKNGNYDGGAGGKFTGRHHYGPDWKQKTALMNQLTNALRGGVTQKQAQGTAQGNQAGNTSAQNVAFEATQNGGGNGTITAEEQKAIKNVKTLHDETEQAWQEYQKAKPGSQNEQNLCQKWKEAQAKEDKARDEATAKGVPFVSRNWMSLEEGISSRNIDSMPVSHHIKQPTEDEIISRISGKDRTRGSCASVALAYIANKCGFDVFDYRGGMSQEFFSSDFALGKIAKLDCVCGKDIVVMKELDGAITELKAMEKGKEYFLGAGGHVAIVRRTAQGHEYLELQSGSGANGWHKLTEKALQKRFECAKRQRKMPHLSTIQVVEVESFKKSREFLKIIEYFNTKEYEQHRGSQNRRIFQAKKI